MKFLVCGCAIILLSTVVVAQNILPELRGKWVISRELPTSTISCWGDDEAQRLIGTEIEYTADSFRWRDRVIQHADVEVALVSAERFGDENSGQGANSSQVSFRQLGIPAANVKEVTIKHPPTAITGATTEIPGDRVLLKNRHTIIFAVGNTYFEAKQVAPPSHR